MLTAGSLFSGSGLGDLGLERAGFKILWQVEKDRTCRKVLKMHWPDVRRGGDIKQETPEDYDRPDLIIGGDPCPIRSKAGSIHGRDKQEDFYPWFLRWVFFHRPLWVLRENVCSPDLDDCAWALECLGYSTAALGVDSAQVTGQSRPREYLLGVRKQVGICPAELFFVGQGNQRHDQEGDQGGLASYCLSANPKRYCNSDNYIFEPGSGFRILTKMERERLQGAPDGWLGDLGEWPAARLMGNAMTMPVVEWIARRIAESMRGAEA